MKPSLALGAASLAFCAAPALSGSTGASDAPAPSPNPEVVSVLVDLDQDGLLDIAEKDARTGTVGWWRNLGYGNREWRPVSHPDIIFGPLVVVPKVNGDSVSPDLLVEKGTAFSPYDEKIAVPDTSGEKSILQIVIDFFFPADRSDDNPGDGPNQLVADPDLDSDGNLDAILATPILVGGTACTQFDFFLGGDGVGGIEWFPDSVLIVANSEGALPNEVKLLDADADGQTDAIVRFGSEWVAFRNRGLDASGSWLGMEVAAQRE